jgi:hypothetical protein
MIPSVSFNIVDGGLGQQNPGNGNILAVIGVAANTGNVPVNVPVQSAQNGAFITAAGFGPGPQLAELILAETGNEVVFIQAAQAASGVCSPVYVGASNTSATVMTFTGYGGTGTAAPIDTAYVLVTCTAAGTIGSGNGPSFSVSLDGGRSVFRQVNNLGTATFFDLSKANGCIADLGISLKFTAAAMALGDVFYGIAQEPTWSDATVAAAIAGLAGIPFGETFVYLFITGGAFVGSYPTPTNGYGTVGAVAADVTAFQTQATNLFNKKRFCRVYCHARDANAGGTSGETETAWIASIEADHLNDSALRVGVGAGHYNIPSPIDQVQYRRPGMWDMAVRASAVAIQVDLGRVSDGSMQPMVLPTLVTWPGNKPGPGPNADGFLYHDEALTPGLDAARFATMMQYIGFPGFYNTAPNLMAPPGSDFNLLEHGSVIDAACLVWYLFATTKLRSGVRIQGAGGSNPGCILEQDRQALEALGTRALRNILTPGNVVSDVYCTVSANDNLLSTSTLTTQVVTVPLGLLVKISTNVLFSNPTVI